MLENSDWVNCDLEYSGDISLRDNFDNMILNIEVKHHIDTVELKDNSSELWKTIYNFYNDSNKYVDETKLALYTVSTVSETNSIFNWNKLSKEDKLGKQGEHHPNNLQLLLKYHNGKKNKKSWKRFTFDEQVEYIKKTISLQSLVAEKFNVEIDNKILEALINRLKMIYS